MTKFEAETKKDFIVINNLATAKEFIAYQIDSNWIYSAHWKSETWITQAREDAIDRIGRLEKNLNELRVALSILDGIEP